MTDDHLTLLVVHAHPDDEVFGTGGVFAKAASEGVRTILVCSTRGEEGFVHDPAANTPEALARLAETREAELASATSILGIDETVFLGYRDSGMLGASSNDDPRAFCNADLDEAAGKVVALIRRYHPQVVVSYDPGGGYGHPDHVMASRVTAAAVEASDALDRYPEAGEPWRIAKYYWSANPREMFEGISRRAQELGLKMPMEDAGYDMEQYFMPQERITTRVDVRAYLETKWRAFSAHATQISGEDLFMTMPEELRTEMFGTEHFVRVRSDVAVPSPETDLFAGLR